MNQKIPKPTPVDRTQPQGSIASSSAILRRAPKSVLPTKRNQAQFQQSQAEPQSSLTLMILSSFPTNPRSDPLDSDDSHFQPARKVRCHAIYQLIDNPMELSIIKCIQARIVHWTLFVQPFPLVHVQEIGYRAKWQSAFEEELAILNVVEYDGIDLQHPSQRA